VLPVTVTSLVLLAPVSALLLACGDSDVDPACRSVDIADPTLEAWVREQTGTATGPIDGEAVAAIDRIEPSSVNLNTITDLGGLECFTGLRVLDMSSPTDLVDLGPLSGARDLEVLRIQTSRVSDLSPIAGLVHLQELSVPLNPISDLSPVSGLAELRRLALSGTEVADLGPVAQLEALEEIYLQGSPPDSLAPLASLTSLRILGIDECEIDDAATSALTGLTALEELRIGGNPDLTSLEFASSFSALQILRANDSSVADLTPLADLSALETLQLRGTEVADLAPLVDLPQLRSLDVSQTGVAELDDVGRIASLEAIAAAGNGIIDLSPLAALDPLGLVDVSDNAITSLAPLADAAWSRCATLAATGNPLDSMSIEQVLPALCEADVVAHWDEGDCLPIACEDPNDG
jgi:hypothetical protein